MFNYVNEDKFLAWYRSAAKAPLADKEVLDLAAKRCLSERRGHFVIPAGESLSGREESYDFRYENIGCCGASTIYFYF